MFTKNFKNLMVLNLLNSKTAGLDYAVDYTTTPAYKTIDGTSITNKDNTERGAISLASALSDTLMVTSNADATSWLIIGTGTGTVSENDYCLFNQDSDCTCVSASSSTTSNLTKSYTASFQNNSESDITVTETGIVGRCWLYNGFYTMLLEHTLLETPVIIPAGETRTITYVWSF
jgi:hypothetical protein